MPHSLRRSFWTTGYPSQLQRGVKVAPTRSQRENLRVTRKVSLAH
ncbi:MAG: hypothetical protein KatS3mg077_1241 [Candidatus Binatia bacterium]|nr:MAG: hypothetical protein KatS3mg077_1241 [Candidatus Binatia bacterium]